ncbi:hypothetical protein FGG08_007689, partial [Glutinoglossum americanum]
MRVPPHTEAQTDPHDDVNALLVAAREFDLKPWLCHITSDIRRITEEGSIEGLVKTIVHEDMVGVETAESSVDISPDGRFFVVAARDALIVWDLETEQELYKLSYDDESGTGTDSLSANLKRVWQKEWGDLETSERPIWAAISCVRWVEGEHPCVVVGCRGGAIIVWDIEGNRHSVFGITGSRYKEDPSLRNTMHPILQSTLIDMLAGMESVRNIAVHPTLPWLAVGGYSSSFVRICDREAQVVLAEVPHDPGAETIDFGLYGQYLITVSPHYVPSSTMSIFKDESVIRLWDLRDNSKGAQEIRFQTPHRHSASAVALAM